MKKAYSKYFKNEYSQAWNQLTKVKKAHAYVAHKFEGNCDPWWFYKTDKYEHHESVSFDWAETPKNPINLEIGNAYYHAEKRLMQIGSRVHKFRVILHRAVESRISKIKGKPGEILQLKVDENSYWFQHGSYSWEKMVFPEENLKIVEL